jgi:hypothetical protein
MPMRGERARVRRTTQSRVDMGQALHVDPDEVAALRRAVHQALKMAEAYFLVEIEPELCRLDRDLRAEPADVDLVQDVQVVLRDLLGFFRAREVLAELGEDRADALPFLLLRGGHRVLEPLARHEGRHRSERPSVARSRSQRWSTSQAERAMPATAIDEAAVHLDRRTGDVGRHRTKEEGAGAAEFVGIAVTAIRTVSARFCCSWSDPGLLRVGFVEVFEAVGRVRRDQRVHTSLV